MMKNKKSDLSIQCDSEGRILSLTNYTFTNFTEIHNELKNKRIFNLLHQNYVLQFINEFTLFLTSKQSFFEKKAVITLINTNFYTILSLEKRHDKIFITVKITSAFDFLPKNKLAAFFFLTRFKFVLGSLIPFIFGTVWTIYKYYKISYQFFILTLLALIFLHIAANTFNDYFDWISKRDLNNIDYVLSSTGGSRAIDFKIISEKHMYILSWICIFIVFIIGIYMFLFVGYKILVLGLIGFFAVYFYSAPPIHLASRYGAGELMHIFCLGPIITYGTVLVLSNNADIIDFIIGFPFGILITCCLLMNEYRDARSDKVSMKINLVVVLTDKYLPSCFTLLLILAFSELLLLIKLDQLPRVCYLILIILPYVYITLKNVFLIKVSRNFASEACLKSLNLYIYTSFLLIISILAAIIIR